MNRIARGTLYKLLTEYLQDTGISLCYADKTALSVEDVEKLFTMLLQSVVSTCILKDGSLSLPEIGEVHMEGRRLIITPSDTLEDLLKQHGELFQTNALLPATFSDIMWVLEKNAVVELL